MSKNIIPIICLLMSMFCLSINTYGNPSETTKKNRERPPRSSALTSIETDYTILKVRSAKDAKGAYIIGSSYEGIIIGVGYDGKTKWETPLSGVMNHDLWCEDITGDGVDEILVANANGTIYCLNNQGKILWEFKANEAPMYSVCAIKKDNKPYVVCGGFDMSIYYLSPTGEVAKEIKSSTYSIEKPWSKFKSNLPPDYTHTANFIRPFKRADGKTVLCVHGTNNQMNVKGTLYLFEPFANKPYRKDKVTAKRVLGDFRVFDTNNDGESEIILGTSAHTNDAGFSVYNQKTGKTVFNGVKKFKTGYVVTQSERVPTSEGDRIFTLVGSHVRLFKLGKPLKEVKKLMGTYAYNDMWKDNDDRILLASSQSGGSCIHIINTKDPKWEKEFENLVPPGKISKILKNTAKARKQLKAYTAPKWERAPLEVTLMSENIKSNVADKVFRDISKNYKSPVFLKHNFMRKVQSPNDWSRDTISNAKYRVKRDKRKQYVLTQQEVLDELKVSYDEAKGMSTWGGHGNDPFFYSPQTLKKIIDLAPSKKTVLIYPEVGDHTDDFNYVLQQLIYPTAEYIQKNNRDAYLYMRYKNIYWQSIIYKPFWKKLMNGELADVIVPALEETSDKTMELSIAGRLGLWSSGVVNQWGTRCVPDNTSFDRSREHSYQRLPNHFLRTYIYHIANGATFINNFTVDQDYISFLWELIAKGALYVPKRNEVLSFSPVHLSMKEPDEEYINRGGNVKWTTFFEPEFEKNNHFVFSRTNGTWQGAPTTKHDFSRYAANVKDRRLNFLPSYNNGMVLITPPQNGVFANKDAIRGKMEDNLHPIYKGIMKEYITDGRNYYSQDGTQTYAANEYYKTIEEDLKVNSKKLPITVNGDVAWVVAQTSPKHLRLTLIDGGYINPDDRKATISFHTVKPKKMKDILDGKTYDVGKSNSIEVDVPCGLFRFLDIELSQEL